MRKIRQFLEEHLFRRDAERLIMSLFTAFILFIGTAFFLSRNNLKQDEPKLFIGLLGLIFLLYLLLMRKMIRQYRVKHWESDKTNWKKGIKGKLRVISRWFDRGN